MSFQKTPRSCRCPAPWRRPPWRRNAWRRRPRASALRSDLARSISVKQRLDEALAEALERLLDAANVAEVAAEADDHAAPRAPAPFVHRARMRPDRFGEADEHRLADQEMADVEFDDLAAGRRCAAPSRSRGRGRRGTSSPAPRPHGRRPRAAARTRARAVRRRPRSTAWHQAPVCSSTTGRRDRGGGVDRLGTGSMNSETRIPRAVQLGDEGRRGDRGRR